MLLEKKIIIFSGFNFSPAYIEKKKKKNTKRFIVMSIHNRKDFKFWLMCPGFLCMLPMMIQNTEIQVYELEFTEL